MKKSKFSLTVTAALVASALGLSSCTSKEEPPEVVYGPPETFERTQEVQDVYGPPVELGLRDEEVQDVYGPPPEAIGLTPPADAEKIEYDTSSASDTP